MVAVVKLRNIQPEFASSAGLVDPSYTGVVASLVGVSAIVLTLPEAPVEDGNTCSPVQRRGAPGCPWKTVQGLVPS